jgi:hypothetical protein
MIRTAVTAVGMVVIAASAQAGLSLPTGGRLVAGHDANVLSTFTAREQEARFAVNLARFITQRSTGGNLLMIEPSTTSVLHDFSPAVEQSLTDAGFTITVTQNTNFTAQALSAFDGIFVGTVFDEPYRMIGNAALDTYLANGGGVYLFSGMGPDLQGEAAALNSFLTPYGLSYDTTPGPGNGGYNGIYNTIITSDHEIFDGITTLRSANGMNLSWNENRMDARIVQFGADGEGLYGVVTNIVPAPGVIALAGVGGLMVMRRRRA